MCAFDDSFLMTGCCKWSNYSMIETFARNSWRTTETSASSNSTTIKNFNGGNWRRTAPCAIGSTYR
jgi:hypothetical protein